MTQIITSFILNRLDNYVQLSKDDVRISLRRRTIDVADVTLKVGMINKHLPLRLAGGSLAAMHIQLPALTSSDPLVVQVHGVNVQLPVDFHRQRDGPPDLDDILSGITADAILGIASTPETGSPGERWDSCVRTTAECMMPGEADDLCRSDAVDDEFVGDTHTPCVPDAAIELDEANDRTEDTAESAASLCPEAISDEEDDMVSCLSVTSEEQDVSSVGDAMPVAKEATATLHDTVGTPRTQRVLQYLRGQAMRPIEWLMQRPLHLEFSDITVTLFCDLDREARLVAHVGHLHVDVHTPHTIAEELLKTLSVTLSELVVGVAATSKAAVTPLLSLPPTATMTLQHTRVFAADMIRLLRQNTVISSTALHISVEEDALREVARCLLARYCALIAPLSALASSPPRHPSVSRWRWAVELALQYVRAQKTRYNFNMSYLRFYAQSRECYLQVLDECHRAHSIDGRQQKLAELEQDLRFSDVVLYLRRKMQVKYGTLHPLCADTVSTGVSEAAEATRMSVLRSIHCECHALSISLPAAVNFTVIDIAVVLRHNERCVTVRDLLVGAHRDTAHSIRWSCLENDPPASAASHDASSTSLLEVTMLESDAASARRDICISLAPLYMQWQSYTLVKLASHLYDATRIAMRTILPSTATATSSGSVREAACDKQRMTTQPAASIVRLVIPRVELVLDAMRVRLVAASFVRSTSACHTGPLYLRTTPLITQYGCVVQELSVIDDDGMYLLHPLRISMQPDDSLAVSHVHVEVRKETWVWWRRTRDLAHAERSEAGLADALGCDDTASCVFAPPHHASSGSELPIAASATMCQSAPPALDDTIRWPPVSLLEAMQQQHCGPYIHHVGQAFTQQDEEWQRVRVCVAGVQVSCPAIDTSLTLSSVQIVSERSKAGSDSTHLLLKDATLRIHDSPQTVQLLAITMSGGMHLMHHVEEGNKAVTHVYCPLLSCSFSEQTTVTPPSAIASACTTTLVQMRHIRCTTHAQLTLCAIESVEVAEGIVLQDVTCLLRPEPKAQPTTERPYRASYLQVALRLQSLDLAALSSVPLHDVGSLVMHLVDFMLTEVIAERPYRVFMSGFNDMAFSVTAEACPLRWGTSDTLHLWLCTASSDTTTVVAAEENGLQDKAAEEQSEAAAVCRQAATSLSAFAPLLPCFATVSSVPLILIDTAQVALCVIAPHLSLQLRRCDDSVAGVVSDGAILSMSTCVTSHVPLAKMSYWCAEVHALPAAALQLAVPFCRCAIRVTSTHAPCLSVATTDPVNMRLRDKVEDVCALLLRSVAYERCTRSAAAMVAHELCMVTSQSSDVGSKASTNEEVLSRATLTFGAWRVTGSVDMPPQRYAETRALAEVMQAMLHSFERRTVIRHSIADVSFDLAVCGALFFSAAHESSIMYITDCAFYGLGNYSQGRAAYMYICSASVVVFQRCNFVYHEVDFIKHLSTTARHSYERCTFTHTPRRETESMTSDTVRPHAVVGPAMTEQLSVQLDNGTVELHLGDSAVATLTVPLTQVAQLRRSRRTTWQARVRDANGSFEESERRVRLCSGVSLDVRYSRHVSRASAKLRCDFACSDVRLPMLAAARLDALRTAWSAVHAASSRCASTSATECSMSLPCDANSTPIAPFDDATHDVTARPTESVKWDLSITTTPFSVFLLLPSFVPVACCSLSGLSVWSNPDATRETAVEAACVVTQVAVWHASTGTLMPVYVGPCVANGQLCYTSSRRVNLSLTVSHASECYVDILQLQLLLAVLRRATELGVNAVNAVNYSGTPVTLRTAAGALTSVRDETALANSFLAVPCGVLDAREVRVSSADAVCYFAQLYNLNDDLGHCSSVIIRARDDAKLHVICTLGSDLLQRACVRTLFQVRNNTSLTLRLIVGDGDDFQDILPKTVSCVPLQMLDREDVGIRVADCSSSAVNVSYMPSTVLLSESLWGGLSPRELLQAVLRGDADKLSALGRQVQLPMLSGRGVYLRVDYDLVDGVLICFLSPARPVLVNDTFIALHLRTVTATPTTTSLPCYLNPSASCFLYDLDPTIAFNATLSSPSPPTPVLGEDESHEMVGDASTLLGVDCQLDGREVEVRLHSTRQSLKSYRMTLKAFCVTSLVTRERRVHIVSDGMYYIRNTCSCSLVVQVSSSTASDETDVAQWQASLKIDPGEGTYLPADTAMRVVISEATFSEVFSLVGVGDEDLYEGLSVQCNMPDSTSRGSAIFLLFAAQRVPHGVIDVAAPLLMYNAWHGHVLRLLHQVRLAEHDINCAASGESHLTLMPSKPHMHYRLATYGYVNQFIFCEAEANIASQLVEIELAANTMWSGYVECNGAYHRVEFAKNHLYETATLIISAPRRALIRFVNLTHTAFCEVGAMSIAESAAQEYEAPLCIHLTPLQDGQNVTTVECRTEPVAASLEAEHTAVVECQRLDYTAKASTYWPTVVTIYDTSQKATEPNALPPEQARKGQDIKKDYMTLGLSLHVGKTVLHLREEGKWDIACGFNSFDFNVAGHNNIWSSQSSVTAIAVHSRAGQTQQCIVAPFDIDYSLHDVIVAPGVLLVKAFQLSVTPVTITLTDNFIYQGQLIVKKTSRAHRSCPREEGVVLDAQYANVGNRQGAQSALRLDTLENVSQPQTTVIVESVNISRFQVEVSWDRKVKAPQSIFLPKWALLRLVPSLHHARISQPMLQIQNLRANSTAELAYTIKQILLLELLRQIPTIIGSIGIGNHDTAAVTKITRSLARFVFGKPKEDIESKTVLLL